MFESEEDRIRQREVANVLQGAWNCELGEFGAFATIDWFAKRERSMMALLELKCRNQASDDYPNTFIDVRKWMALTFGAMAFGCPALYVVRFTDGIFWRDIAALDTSRNCVIGRKDREAFYAFDVHPAIYIPVATMKPLAICEPDAFTQEAPPPANDDGFPGDKPMTGRA